MTIHQLANLKTNDYIIDNDSNIYKVTTNLTTYAKFIDILNYPNSIFTYQYINKFNMNQFRKATKLDKIKFL